MEQPATPEPGRKSGGLSVARLWPLALVVAAIALFFALGWNQYLSFQSLRDHRQILLLWTGEHQVQAVVLFMAVYVLVVALSLPGAIWITLTGGFLFGTVVAALAAVSAATLGAVVIFLVARYALADFFRAKMGSAGRKMEAGFRKNALSYLLVLRLVPLFPFWLVNLVPAFLGVPLRTYIIGTFFGIIPGSLVICSIGSGLGAVFDAGEDPDLGIIFSPEILGPILGLALLSLLPIVYKRFQSSKEPRQTP